MRPNIFVLFPILITLTAGCGPADPGQQFWTWFQDNSDALRQIETAGSPELVDRLAAELRKVREGLVFEIGGNPGEERELIISADGIRELFPAVEALTASAPAIPGWKVIAFRPRIGTGFAIRFDDYELDPEDFWFRAVPDGDLLGLEIYLPGIGGEHHDTALSASFIMLDSALGEYDVVTRIGFIEHRVLPHDPEAAGLRPLEELPDTVDQYLK